MRLRLLPALPLFLLATPCFAQWTWLYPKPQGNSLYDVEFLDANTAIAVGDASTVLVTHDGGATWSVSTFTAGATATLRGVAAIDAHTAVAVGDNNTVIKTEDAGATWQLVPVGGTGNLTSVDFLGQLGLAVRDGTIRRSTNGGANWTQVLVGYDVNAVDVVSSSVAVAVGSYLFLRSEDGGETWATTFFIDGGSCISFLNPSTGVIGSRFSVFSTIDGGQTWTQTYLNLETETSAYPTEIELIDTHTIVCSAAMSGGDVYTGLASYFGQFFSTTNTGAMWNPYWGTRMLRGLSVSPAGVVLVVGDAGTIYRWNAPESWEQASGSQYGYFVDVGASAFRSPAEGVVVGVDAPIDLLNTGSTFVRTSDGGGSWAAKWYASTHITAVTYSPGTGAAYAVGKRQIAGTASAILLRSIDGGATWPLLWSGAGLPELYGVSFSSATHGIAVGAGGSTVLIDHDIVTPGTIPGGVALWDVEFTDGSTAVAVGSKIFRTTDGSSWTEIPTGVSAVFYAIDFASPSVGVAAGSGGTVLRTEDGGLTWTAMPSHTTSSLRALSFGSELYGVAVGGSSTVIETIDGGQTWTRITAPTLGAYFSGVTCFGPHHFIVTDGDLKVLEYQLTPVPTLITNFDAAAEPFAAALRWSVRDEADLDRFTIQRRDGEGSSQRTVAGDLCACARYYLDETVTPGASYEYQLVAVDHDGTTIPSAPVRVTIPVASVELLPNHPNPFNPSTTISFVLPARAHARLAVYDVAGRHVVTLVDETRGPGRHSVAWNGVDARGVRAASGVYMSRLDVGTVHATRKMVLLK